MKQSYVIAMVVSLLVLQGCAYDPAYKNGSILEEAGSAFMEGFIPTRTQIQNAAQYPGYEAGQAIAR